MADELIELVEDDEDVEDIEDVEDDELELEDVKPSFEQSDFTSKTVYDFIFDFYDDTVGKKSFYNVVNNNFNNIKQAIGNIKLESSAITFNSDMTLKAGLEEQYNIGSSASAWKNIYATVLYLKSKKALSTNSAGDTLKINANANFNTIDIIGGTEEKPSKLQLTAGGGLRFTYGDARFFNLSSTGSLQVNGQQGGVFEVDSKGRLKLSNDVYTYLDFSSSTTDGGPRIEINDSNLNITDTSGHSDMSFSTGSKMSFETQSDNIDINSGSSINMLADTDVYTQANTTHIESKNQFRSIAGTDYKFYPCTTTFKDNSEAILMGSEEYDDKRVKRKYLFATRKDLPDVDDHTGNVPFGVEWETGDIYFRGKKFDPDNVATKMITGEGFIVNGETITFGSAGNYKEKLDLSNLIEGGPTGYSDNDTTNTQFKQDSVLKIHVQEGGYVTLVGYSGYSAYTITVNGEESGELTGTKTSQVAKYDQDILITSKSSSNYYVSITVYNMVETTLTDKIKELDDKIDHIKLESSSITFNSSLIPNAAGFDLGVATNDATNKKYRWNNIYSNALYTNHIQRVSGEELTISGDTDFEDQVTVEGVLNTSDIIPTAHETSSIGTSALNYNKIYLQSIYLSNKKALSASITDTSNTLKINGSKHFDSVDICVSTDDPSSSITPKLQISKYGALTLKNAVNDTTFRVKSDGAIIANRKHSGDHDTFVINPSGDDDTYFHMNGDSIRIHEDGAGGSVSIYSQGWLDMNTGSNDMTIHSGDGLYLESSNSMTIDSGWNLDLLSYESMAFFTKKKMALGATDGIKLYPNTSGPDRGSEALLSGTEEYDDKKVQRKYLFATRQALPDDTNKGNIPFGIEWGTGDIYIRGNKFDPQNIEAETLKATKEIDLGDSYIRINDDPSTPTISADFKLPTSFDCEKKLIISSDTDLILMGEKAFDIGTAEGPGISCFNTSSTKTINFYNYADDEIDPVMIEWKADKTNILYVDNIIPITSNAFSLGSSTYNFKNLWLNTLYINNLKALSNSVSSSDNTNILKINGSNNFATVDIIGGSNSSNASKLQLTKDAALTFTSKGTKRLNLSTDGSFKISALTGLLEFNSRGELEITKGDYRVLRLAPNEGGQSYIDMHGNNLSIVNKDLPGSTLIDAYQLTLKTSEDLTLSSSDNININSSEDMDVYSSSSIHMTSWSNMQIQSSRGYLELYGQGIKLHGTNGNAILLSQSEYDPAIQTNRSYIFAARSEINDVTFGITTGKEFYVKGKKVTHVITGATITGDTINLTLEEV